MIEPLANSTNYQLAGKLLDAAVLRHQAIASNIANVETPGYRRVDLAPNFAAALQAEFSTAGHGSTADLKHINPTLAADLHTRAERADGNNVELEDELMAMSRNNVDYEFLSEMVSRHIKGLKMAITGRVL